MPAPIRFRPPFYPQVQEQERPLTTPLLAAAVGLLAGLAAVTTVCGWWVLPLALAAAVGTAVVGWLAMRKIGGLVGDALGAIEQVVECLVLIVVSGLAAPGGSLARRLFSSAVEGLSLGALGAEAYAPAMGYVAFAVTALYLITLWWLPGEPARSTAS